MANKVCVCGCSPAIRSGEAVTVVRQLVNVHSHMVDKYGTHAPLSQIVLLLLLGLES